MLILMELDHLKDKIILSKFLTLTMVLLDKRESNRFLKDCSKFKKFKIRSIRQIEYRN